MNDETQPLEPADAPQRFGAAAARDAEVADRATDQAAGNERDAERRFDEEAEGPAETVPEGADDDG